VSADKRVRRADLAHERGFPAAKITTQSDHPGDVHNLCVVKVYIFLFVSVDKRVCRAGFAPGRGVRVPRDLPKSNTIGPF